jgi:uncharacterized protein YegJ (DUF2314 family)
MKRTSSVLLMIGVSLALLTGCSTKRDKVVKGVEDDDPEMVAAIGKARRTLPQFWQAFDKRDRGETNFSLKIKITDKTRIEHFWITDIERQDGKVRVAINHAPKIVANVKLGERLEIPEAEIQDWYYMRGGKMIGNQTIRPMLKMMTAEEAARVKTVLEDPEPGQLPKEEEYSTTGLRVECHPEKPKFVIGEPVILRWTVTNTTDGIKRIGSYPSPAAHFRCVENEDSWISGAIPQATPEIDPPITRNDFEIILPPHATLDILLTFKSVHTGMIVVYDPSLHGGGFFGKDALEKAKRACIFSKTIEYEVTVAKKKN